MQRPWLVEGQLDWLWAHAERHNMPAMLLVAHQDLPYVAQLAERHPGPRPQVQLLDRRCAPLRTWRGLRHHR